MLFRFSDVSKSYGAQDVLRAVNFQINPGEHVGLVGRNGAGKTTILRLIEETETPDAGAIEKLRGLRLGVLQQQVDFRGEESVLDAALEVFSELRALAIAQPADTRGQTLEMNLLLCQLDPALQRCIFREKLQHGFVSAIDILGIAG